MKYLYQVLSPQEERKTVTIQTIDTLITKIDSVHNSIQSEVIRSVSRGLVLRNWIIGY